MLGSIAAGLRSGSYNVRSGFETRGAGPEVGMAMGMASSLRGLLRESKAFDLFNKGQMKAFINQEQEQKLERVVKAFNDANNAYIQAIGETEEKLTEANKKREQVYRDIEAEKARYDAELESARSKYSSGKLSKKEYRKRREKIEEKHGSKMNGLTRALSGLETEVKSLKNRMSGLSEGGRAAERQGLDRARSDIESEFTTPEMEAAAARATAHQERMKKAESKYAAYSDNPVVQELQGMANAERRMAFDMGTKNIIGRSHMNASIVGDATATISKVGGWLSKAGGSMGGKAGGMLSKLGGGITKATAAFGKMIPVIGWVITALQLFGEALSAYYDINKIRNKYTGLYEEIDHRANVEVYSARKEEEVAKIQKEGTIKIAQLQAQSQNAIEATNMKYQQMVNSVDTITGLVTGGILNTAFDSARKAYKFGADMEKLGVAMEYRAGQVSRTTQLEEVKLGATMREKELAISQAKETAVAKRDLTQAQQRREMADQGMMTQVGSVMADDIQTRRDALGGQLGSETTHTGSLALQSGEDAAINAAANSLVGDLIGASGARKGFLDMLVSGSELSAGRLERYQEGQRLMTQYGNQIANTLADFSKQAGDIIADTAKQTRDAAIDAYEQMAEAFLKFSQDMTVKTNEYDEKLRSTLINLGYTQGQQLHGMVPYMMRMLSGELNGGMSLFQKYGTNLEDAVKIQQEYNDATGRNRPMSYSSYESALSLGRVIGNQSEATKILSEFDIRFNKSFNSTTAMLSKTFDKLNKLGLNVQAYAKDIVKNLATANKFQFKGGTKGMMDMAVWAQKVKFNMDSLGQVLEKGRNGGLEGIIKQSAQLQVLGGSAALVSDPLGMMYDLWNDPRSYAQRIVSSTKGFGSVDKTTGETTFNQVEQMTMAEIAKAFGMSLDDLMKQTREANKREVVKNELTDSQLKDLTKDQQEFLMSSAKYDEENQKWIVDTLDGVKDLNTIGKGDLERIIPAEHNERMEEYAAELVSIGERMLGQEEGQRVKLAADEYVTIMNGQLAMMAVAEKAFNEQRNTYNEAVKTGMTDAVTSFRGYIDIFNTNKPEIDKDVSSIRNHVSTFASEMGTLNGIISKANASLSGTLEEFTNDAKAALLKAESNGAGWLSEMMRNVHENYDRTLEQARQIRDAQEAKREAKETRESLGGSRSNAFVGPKFDAVAAPASQPHLITGGNVKSINDGAVTHPDDTIYAIKDDGPLGKSLYSMAASYREIANALLPMTVNRVSGGYVDEPYGQPRNINVNFGGTLRVEGENGQIVELVLNDLNNDPVTRREFANAMFKAMDEGLNQGRQYYSYRTRNTASYGL